MAMKWVRQNIKNFGGNPNNVTIFGYSSGGISVLAHMASQASKSMFDKAIALSGAWYPKGRTLKQAEESGVIDSQKWGCAGNEINTLECLRSQPINRIVQASPPPGEYEFVPLVDGKLLNQAPDAAFRKGEFSKVPFITSATSDEYGLYLFDLGEQTKDTFAQTIADYLSPYADRKIPPADIVKEYKLDQYKSPTKVLSSAVTDFMIACQQLKTAENMVKYNPDIWAFQFSAKSNPKPNFDVPVWFGDIGNFHGVDHPYYFGNFDQPVSKDINELAITLRSYLSNFARTSNPNGNGAAVWKRLSESPDTVLNASTPIDPNWNAKKQHHCSFWADYELQL
ncbi:Carboxylesterase [compost metagenome]